MDTGLKPIRMTLDDKEFFQRDPFFRVPSDGKYLVALHDQDCAAWNYKPRPLELEYKKDPPANALPETVPTAGCKEYGEFVPLSEKWQWFWFGLLMTAAPRKSVAELKAAWASLTANARALTDQHAVQNGYADYVLGKNLTAPPMSIKCLTMGGNLLKWTGEFSGGKYVVEALDASKDPPMVIDVWEKWWLVHWCTESTVLPLPGRRYQVGRFPQLEPFGCPFPFITMTGRNKIERNRVEAIGQGNLYTPYVLA